MFLTILPLPSLPPFVSFRFEIGNFSAAPNNHRNFRIILTRPARPCLLSAHKLTKRQVKWNDSAAANLAPPRFTSLHPADQMSLINATPHFSPSFRSFPLQIESNKLSPRPGGELLSSCRVTIVTLSRGDGRVHSIHPRPVDIYYPRKVTKMSGMLDG